MVRNENAIIATIESLLVITVNAVKEADMAEAWGGGANLPTMARAEVTGVKKALMAAYIANGMDATDAKAKVEAVAKGEQGSNGYTV